MRANRERALRRVALWMTIGVLAGLLAGCEESPEPTPEPTPTVVVAVSDAEEAAAAPAAEAVEPAVGVAAPTPGARVENPVPREIARLPLAEGETHLLDFRLDAARGVAYLTDSDLNLHIVDTATAALLQTIKVSGERLTLDAANTRLYAAPDLPSLADGAPQITVIDTAARTVVGTLPGSRVSVDSARNRVYAGDIVSFFDSETPGVRLHDAATLVIIAQGELAGDPRYNPARDELIIVNYAAFAADPATLAVRGTITPDIDEQEMRGCNGCLAVEEAFFFPEESLIALDVQMIATGGGPGRIADPRFLDAATLEPAAAPADLHATCSSLPVLHTLQDGAVLQSDFFARYVVYNNLALKDEAGRTLTFKDGLADPFPNPATGVLYARDSFAATYILDRSTLAPVGLIDGACFFARDGASGRLYATDAARTALLIFEETGGQSSALPPGPHTLAGNPIDQVVPSPAFAADQTIFALTWSDEIAGQVAVRSTDGGATWTRLGGGLPVGDDLTLTLAVSPTYPDDRTLFAGGMRRDAIGEGVWRSTDGGDTWLPQWVGLEHLRVQRIAVSPRFAQDGALLAYGVYNRIAPYEHGYSLHRSTDGGLSWTKVITAESAELLPAPSVYLPLPVADDLPIKKESWRYPLMVRLEGAQWVTVTAAFATDETVRATLAAPAIEPDRGARDLFVVTDQGVYRSADGGVGWSQWQDARLAGRTYENDLRSAAVTPRLADGSYRLLVGTADGELWQLDPATMTFVELPPAAPALAAAAPISATVGVGATPATAVAVTATVAPTPTVAPTNAPTLTPTAALTATAAQPATATPPPTASAPLSVTAPAGLFVPQGEFASRWAQDANLQQLLGFARTERATVVPAAYQFFERGVMLWRGDTATIEVFLRDNSWQSHPDTFKEGEPERDPNLYTPGELLQPIRGFGKLWRTQEGLREAIGWATAEEEGVNAAVQEFERGVIVRAGGLTYVLTTTAEGPRWRP